MTERQLQACRQRLDTFLQSMLTPLGRSERRRWGSMYVRGLLLDGDRKSAGAMAARLPEGNEQNLQQFLNQSPWPWEPVWQRLAQQANHAGRVLGWIIDDTGFAKQGVHSVGVQRQYSGTLGRTGNCQVAVSLHQANSQASSPLAWRLYLPESWTRDQKRRDEAGIPEQVKFHKKWELALQVIDQALGWNLAKPSVVLADADYGTCQEFRQGLEERELPYAVGTKSQVLVWPKPPKLTPHEVSTTGRPPRRQYDYGEQKPVSLREVAKQNRTRFRIVTWREASKGALRSYFFACRVQLGQGYVEGQAPGKAVWLLMEWPKQETEPTRYYLCDLPANWSVRRLVATARGRWRIEQDYQQMKEELGLDHFEGRSWAGWHHHITLVMMAHAFLRREQRRRWAKSSMELTADAA